MVSLRGCLLFHVCVMITCGSSADMNDELHASYEPWWLAFMASTCPTTAAKWFSVFFQLK